MTPDRFWVTVKKTTGCWFWVGRRNRSGYGEFTERGRRKMAHRHAYELTNGAIPTGLIVRHRCDVPQCVRPDHLELGTTADNQRDKAIRGRSLLGKRNVNAKLTARQVDEIRRAYKPRQPDVSAPSLAKRFGVSTAH